MKLLTYQQALLMNDPNRLKVVVHDRCVGATVAAIHRAVALESEKPGGTYYLTNAVEAVVERCLEQAKDLGVATTSQTRTSGNAVITLENGGYIDVWKHRDEIRRLPGVPCRVVIDSAAYLPNLAALWPAVSIYPDVLLLSDWATEGEDKPNLFNSLVKQIYIGQMQDASLHIIDMKNALQDGLYRSMCQQNGQTWSEEAEHKWLDRRIRSQEQDPNWRSVLTHLEEYRQASQTLQQE